MAEELSLDDWRILSNQFQVAFIICFGECGATILLQTDVAFIWARWNMSHNVDLRKPKLISFVNSFYFLSLYTQQSFKRYSFLSKLCLYMYMLMQSSTLDAISTYITNREATQKNKLSNKLELPCLINSTKYSKECNSRSYNTSYHAQRKHDNSYGLWIDKLRRIHWATSTSQRLGCGSKTCDESV